MIAAGAGRVISAAPSGGYGNAVVIDHGGAWQTLYAHLAGFDVRADDCVKAGTVIGTVGATGMTIGPGLHFEVRRDGAVVDPLRLPLKPRASGLEDKDTR